MGKRGKKLSARAAALMLGVSFSFAGALTALAQPGGAVIIPVGQSSGGPGAVNSPSTSQEGGTVIELPFKLVTPAHFRGDYNVAWGSVQRADGTWADVSYDYAIMNPYYRVLREETDSTGVEWYVCAAHATKAGDYFTDDGSFYNELWLKKADCTETSSVTVDTDNETRIKIVETALSTLGMPYQAGTAGPDSFDCSGYVYYVMNTAGVSVPRTSSDAMLGLGRNVSYEELKPGDILGRPGHVGVYIGDGKFVHASETATGVISDTIEMYSRVHTFTNYVNVVGD